jgi:hypothetical protein
MIFWIPVQTGCSETHSVIESQLCNPILYLLHDCLYQAEQCSKVADYFSTGAGAFRICGQTVASRFPANWAKRRDHSNYLSLQNVSMYYSGGTKKGNSVYIGCGVHGLIFWGVYAFRCLKKPGKDRIAAFARINRTFVFCLRREHPHWPRCKVPGGRVQCFLQLPNTAFVWCFFADCIECRLPFQF